MESVIRTVVYPSFGIPGNPPESTVLIASYSWTEVYDTAFFMTIVCILTYLVSFFLRMPSDSVP